jgi:hypothetical protein
VEKITLPYAGGAQQRVKPIKTSILMPHKVFAQIYKCNKGVFMHKFMGGCHENVPNFWDAMRSHPSYADHPDAGTRGFQERMIPLELHMDGVPVTAVARKASQSAVIYSFRHNSDMTLYLCSYNVLTNV